MTDITPKIQIVLDALFIVVLVLFIILAVSEQSAKKEAMQYCKDNNFTFLYTYTKGTFKFSPDMNSIECAMNLQYEINKDMMEKYNVGNNLNWSVSK